MEEKSKDIGNSIKTILERLDKLELRISNLEKKKASLPASENHELLVEKDEISPFFPKLTLGVTRVKILSVIGRTFLVLAGAFLLRAFTENQTLTPIIGVAIGLAYALIWLFFANRTAGRNELFTASFHGISSVLIAFPLIFEASIKLNVFTPVQTIIILGLFLGLALTVAAYRNLRSVYVFYILAALFTSIPLMYNSGKVEFFTIFIIIIGLTTIAFKYFRSWHIMPWISVFFVNLSVAFLASLASAPDKLVGHYSEISISFSLIIIIFYIITYLTGFITATLYLKRQISVFGMFQSIFALIIGLISAISITHGIGIEYNILGLFTAIFSIGFYITAFKYLRPEAKVNFYYYTWMAFILAVAGIWILCNENVKILSLGILSLVAILLTKYVERFNTLSIQSALYLLLTVWFAKLLQFSISSFISTDNSWIVFSPVIILVLALTITVYVFHILLGNQNEQKIQMPRFVVLLVTALGIFGFIVSSVSKIFVFNSDPINLSNLALIRTIVLAIFAVILAWLGNKSRLYELSFLVYPVLIIGGLKLLFEDLGAGTPITLFIGFVFYGFALISAPKIKRKVKSAKLNS
ncbi:MAG: hypothetical protein PF485_10425 [Bacteroidales bacterium]|jgi:hypothetical protein|nr:hypothetical protein [Bacteroidales bacterium]